MRPGPGRCAGVLVVVAGVLGVAAGGREARAQIRYVGPGSTPEGDISRGYGVFYQGLGPFNYFTAMANAIDADTLMRVNEYVYQSRLEWNRQRLARIRARAENRKRSFAEIQDRLRRDPDPRDVYSGDALNALLADMSAAAFSPSVLRYDTQPLAVESVRAVPYLYPAVGGVVSLRRMLVADSWPTALNDPALAPEKAAYLRAVDAAMERLARGQLTLADGRAVAQAVEALRARVDSEPEPVPRREAREFLKRLDTAARMLQASQAVAALAELDRYSGTTVADFLEFMQRYNFRFAPAVNPYERMLYSHLFGVLKEQKEKLGIQAQAPPARERGAVQ